MGASALGCRVGGVDGRSPGLAIYQRENLRDEERGHRMTVPQLAAIFDRIAASRGSKSEHQCRAQNKCGRTDEIFKFR